MCVHSTKLERLPYRGKFIDTCSYCAHLGTPITERPTPFTKPTLSSGHTIDDAALLRDEQYTEWEDEERYKAALDAKYGKGPLAWEYGKGDWRRLRDRQIADFQGLRPARLRVVKNFWEDEQGPSGFAESGEAVLPEVLSLFQKSGSRLWLRAMYDSVFPENTERLEENARREKFNRRKLAQHRRIWDSIALGKAAPQARPKLIPLLHTIYSASKRTARNDETWAYAPWKGKSRFSDLASAEDRAQCYPADFTITHVLDFSETDQPIRGETADQHTLRQAAALTSLPVFPYRQSSEGFGKKFFEMQLDEGEEGKLFLPSTKSGQGWTEGRELGCSDATLVFDKTTSTFYLQKVKQAKKAAIRGDVQRKERKRADAKLSLFSLSALEKGGAKKLLDLWETVTKQTLHDKQWKIVSENFTPVEYLRDDKELMQRFLRLAVKFCSQQAAASIEYKPAVSLSAHRRMNLEEQEQMICNSSQLEVTEDYAKWVARAYALLMLPAGVRGSVRALGWPDQRYWEPFRDADGGSPASASPAKEWKDDQEEEEETIETEEGSKTVIKYRRKLRFEELRTAADQSRADDWEGSEQEDLSGLSM